MNSLPPPFKHGVPVPLLLWDALEDTMRANMRRLAKDIATTLGQSETPLLEALFKGDGATIKPYLYESPSDHEIDMTCTYMCQRPDAPRYLQRCGQPVLWSAYSPHISRCTEHLYSKDLGPTTRLTKLRPMQQLKDEIEEPLFQSKDGTIYNAEFTPRGRYSFTKKVVKLFTVLEN